MRKYLISFLLLAGCVGYANNQIGYGVPLGQEIAVDCIVVALKSIDGIDNMHPIERGYHFEIKRYDVSVFFEIANTTNTSRYDVVINGQFVGEEIGVFYSNAQKLSNNIKKVVLNVCGNNL